MIHGYFDERGKLYFDLDLVAVDGSFITVDALLDTGFTDWLAMNIQDIESLDWSFIKKETRQTARGNGEFFLYQGTVIFDNKELTIPALGGEEISEILIGLPWLENRRLVVDRKANLLTMNAEQQLTTNN
ncbi:MAG: aspartyl protease [Rivularia sp. (in: cyanobacteria)]